MQLNPNLCRIQPPVSKTVRGYEVFVRQLNGLQQIQLDADLMSIREKFTEEDETNLTQAQMMERFLYATAARVKHHIVLEDGTPLFQNQSLDEIINNNAPDWIDALYQAIDTDTETTTLSEAEKNS